VQFEELTLISFLGGVRSKVPLTWSFCFLSTRSEYEELFAECGPFACLNDGIKEEDYAVDIVTHGQEPQAAVQSAQFHDKVNEK
jgi:hypothetical protein